MIIILKKNSTKKDAEVILQEIENAGLKPLFLPGVEKVVIGAIGDERLLESKNFDSFPQVQEVKRILTPYKLVSREFKETNSIVKIGDVPFGGQEIIIIAGPCAVESLEQMDQSASVCKQAKAKVLRGGAFKPRTSPYSFQGLEQKGLNIIKQISSKYSMPTVTEVVEISDLDAIEESVDAFQIGARNMQNFSLLKEVGQRKKPVILKRGFAAKIEDLLLAAEYILAHGNENVILCERGIRTFETAYRNTLDLNAVALLKARTHLPVIVDPSHATGVRDLVPHMSYAAIAAGADGIMVDVHPDPTKALCDGMQSLYPEQFVAMMDTLIKVAHAIGRSI